MLVENQNKGQRHTDDRIRMIITYIPLLNFEHKN